MRLRRSECRMPNADASHVDAFGILHSLRRGVRRVVLLHNPPAGDPRFAPFLLYMYHEVFDQWRLDLAKTKRGKAHGHVSTPTGGGRRRVSFRSLFDEFSLFDEEGFSKFIWKKVYEEGGSASSSSQPSCRRRQLLFGDWEPHSGDRTRASRCGAACVDEPLLRLFQFGPRGKADPNAVFQMRDFFALAEALQTASAEGSGAVATIALRTVGNAYWGVERGRHVHLTVYLVGNSRNWLHHRQSFTQSALANREQLAGEDYERDAAAEGERDRLGDDPKLRQMLSSIFLHKNGDDLAPELERYKAHRRDYGSADPRRTDPMEGEIGTWLPCPAEALQPLLTQYGGSAPNNFLRDLLDNWGASSQKLPRQQNSKSSVNKMLTDARRLQDKWDVLEYGPDYWQVSLNLCFGGVLPGLGESFTDAFLARWKLFYQYVDNKETSTATSGVEKKDEIEKQINLLKVLALMLSNLPDVDFAAPFPHGPQLGDYVGRGVVACPLLLMDLVYYVVRQNEDHFAGMDDLSELEAFYAKATDDEDDHARSPRRRGSASWRDCREGKGCVPEGGWRMVHCNGTLKSLGHACGTRYWSADRSFEESERTFFAVEAEDVTDVEDHTGDVRESSFLSDLPANGAGGRRRRRELLREDEELVSARTTSPAKAGAGGVQGAPSSAEQVQGEKTATGSKNTGSGTGAFIQLSRTKNTKAAPTQQNRSPKKVVLV